MTKLWGRLTSSVPAPSPGSRLWEPWQRLTRLNTKLYRLTGGRVGGSYDGAPVCILHHRGARTGESRETPLLYLDDHPRVVVVASMGGVPNNPAWFHNVKAHPDVTVEIGGERRPVRARVAPAEERARLWPRLLELWPAWEAYQARTSRTIPVVVLEPRT